MGLVPRLISREGKFGPTYFNWLERRSSARRGELMKKKTWLVLGMAGMLLLNGCGGSAKSEDAMAMQPSRGSNGYVVMDTADFGYASKSEAMPEAESSFVSDGSSGIGGFGEGGFGETEVYNTESEKLIRTVTMSLQTKEFETLLSYLDGKVAELGGYIQNSQIYGNSMDSYGYRSASMTLRIPQSSLDFFVSGVSENATVVRKTENAENITLQYADTEARLKSLKIEQERFLELLEKADTVDSIIAIEEHLTELRYEIESYASTLKVYDNKVSYSTVTLDISEVKRITPVEQDPTLFTRMKEGFSDTWYELKDGATDVLVWFVSNFLYLLIWGVILVAAVIFIRRKIKRKRLTDAAAKTTVTQQPEEEQHDRMDFEK